jgi:hypothetical protein
MEGILPSIALPIAPLCSVPLGAHRCPIPPAGLRRFYGAANGPARAFESRKRFVIAEGHFQYGP